ncbi:TauD/TfdA dioxygenase family protein [Streptomyces flaveus]|uniref:Dioxygenase TauD/TfdA family protein n=1 Tax=Streptomyces flaveus TaxID=66370 RepID=A0A917VBB4_9ACTN|nr:TauD/TfdA family dioxygenase [Streptomyces flaveus]GGK59266.1 dioxygenase TauD/TfdA family protein [Streptomyces flaveus]
MPETHALNPSLGVEFTHVTDPLDEKLVARCAEALKWRGVLLIRGLNLDDEQQIALSSKLGEVVSVRGKRIFPISLDPSKNPSAEYLRGTFHWHLDGTTDDDVPVKATTLTARHVAMKGGGTEFANTYAAYENLPEQDRKRYESLRVVHSFAAAQLRAKPDPSEKELARWRSLPEREMSLVWRRRDGRRSLVIGTTADRIVGMAPDEGRALLDELQDWCTQDRFRYTHDWQVGDFVAWDNTAILHRALPYDRSSERLLHRTTVVGDEAFG